MEEDEGEDEDEDKEDEEQYSAGHEFSRSEERRVGNYKEQYSAGHCKEEHS